MPTLEDSPERPARFRGRNIVLDDDDIDAMTEPPSRRNAPIVEESLFRGHTPIGMEESLSRGHTPCGTEHSAPMSISSSSSRRPTPGVTEQPPSRWPTPGVAEQSPSRWPTPSVTQQPPPRENTAGETEPASTRDTPHESELPTSPATPSEYVQGSSSDSSCDTSGPKRKTPKKFNTRLLKCPGKFTTNMVRLLRLKPQRQVQYRPGKEEMVNLRRVKNCEALLLQTMGKEADAPCARCSAGRGPFQDCVRIPDMMQGCCGNCHYGSNSNECCFHTNKGQDTTARQTTRPFARKRKAPIPSYSVSSTSPPRRVTRNSSGHSAVATDRSNPMSTTQNATPGSRSLWAADLEYIAQQNKRPRVLPSLDPIVSDHIDCMRRELRHEMRRGIEKAMDRMREEFGGQIDLLTQRLDEMGFRHDDDLVAIVRTMRTLAERE
ncbi:hypothetical protein CDD80_6496 [Ophiocordyceps camponoti-rufipedis]|uniref:Uncharacterized protein n=1 Tax=Ophiocordyceps camponoti-rufipedis TaxID=2004952 RepID=A0A2C5YQ08_9HYPO|nr:hypothetical protein CDD80_6496 [Ophiocordyceps camponoti-rufipedis]